MTDKPTVSQSKASRWNTCRASYHYKYNMGLGRRRVARPLTFGSAVHKVIEDSVAGVSKLQLKKSLDAWATAELKKSNYFTAELEMFHEAVAEAWDVMREYATFWPKNHLTYMPVKGRKAEHEIRWDPPGEDFTITGKIDAYARSENKLKWLVEHKSGKTLMAEEDRWRSIQGALYITVGRELGHPEVDGMVWDMIRSKTPTRPHLNKDGSFSLAKLDSMPSVVIDTIKAAGQNPKDYPTLIASAEANRNQWFQRVFQPVTENVRAHLYNEFTETARDIIDNGHKVHRMTIGKHCGWCDYEPICRAMMSGSDHEYVIEKEFTVAEAPAKTVADKPKQKAVAGKIKAKPAVKRGVIGRRLAANAKDR